MNDTTPLIFKWPQNIYICFLELNGHTSKGCIPASKLDLTNQPNLDPLNLHVVVSSVQILNQHFSFCWEWENISESAELFLHLRILQINRLSTARPSQQYSQAHCEWPIQIGLSWTILHFGANIDPLHYHTKQTYQLLYQLNQYAMPTLHLFRAPTH